MSVGPLEVTVDLGGTTTVTVPPTTGIGVEVGLPGPPGPPGPDGPPGPAGPIFMGQVGAGTDVPVTHNLGSQAVTVQVIRMAAPWDTVMCDVTRPTVDTVMLHFVSPVLSGEYGCIVLSAEAPPQSGIDVRDYGAVGDGTTDDQDAVQEALDSLTAGDTLLFPAGFTFAHSGVLLVSVDGVTLSGGGTLLATDEDASALMVRDVSDVTVQHLTLDNSASTYRHAAWEQTGLLLLDTTGCTVDDVTIKRSGAAGLQIEGSSDFTVTDVTAQDTWSDGIHMTGGSHDGYLNGLLVERSGDDGLACVSYETAPVNADIVAENVTVRDQLTGRSFSVVGGERITYRHIVSERSAGAAIMVACEGSYLTHGVDTVLVEDAQLVESNAVGPDQGAVLIYSGREGFAVSNVTLRDLVVTDTNVAASRQFGIIAEGYSAITTTVITRVSMEGIDFVGGGDLLYVNAPPTSYRYTGITEDGNPLPDYLGWS